MTTEGKWPQLTPRLACIAQMVRPGAVVADIGTDHAHLPVALVMEGICPHAYACDVAQGPLDRAKANILRHGQQERIPTILADGLAGVEQSDADTIVIAGMGGETIRDILQPSALARKPEVTLLLQPMTAYPQLKAYLFEAGWQVQQERAVQEGEKCYTVLQVVRGQEPHPEEIYQYIGWHLWQQHDSVTEAYLHHQYRRYLRIWQGMARSSDGGQEDKRRAVRMVLDQLEQRWEEQT